MSTLRNPHLLLIITTLIWGGNAVAGKFAVGHVSPMMLTCLRWGIALVIISWIAREQLQKDLPVIKQNWLYLALMGGFGYTAFNYTLYSAVQYTSAINVALEQSAMPVIIFVLSYVIYRTGITWLQIFGFLLTMVGVAVIVSSGAPLSLLNGDTSTFNRGDLFMAFAALFYGGYSVGLRSKPQMHWQSLLATLIAAAFVFALIGVSVEFWAGNTILPTTTQGYLVVLFTGIFPSLVSQGFFIKGVEALGANIAGLYINLVPVFGALLAVLLLGESLYLFHALAFVLVASGIMIAQHKTA